jgi:glucose-1-phosphatase
MIDLFVFDLGGVLVNNFDVIPEAARRLGMTEAEFRSQARVDMESYMSGRMDANAFWDRFAARTGIRAPENYWATLFQPVRDPEVEALVRALKPFGRVVCGTNTIDVHYDALASAGCYDAFDAVYASHRMGVSKPDPGFWRRILESEEKPAGRAFFTDDMEENIQVARGLGFQTHHFLGAASLAAALAESGFPVGAPRNSAHFKSYRTFERASIDRNNPV